MFDVKNFFRKKDKSVLVSGKTLFEVLKEDLANGLCTHIIFTINDDPEQVNNLA